MSDAHNEHESLIKTPKQLIAAIAAGFLIPIIAIVLLVQYVASESTSGAGSDSQTPEAIAARLKPVADVGFTLKDANAPKVLQTGEAVYKAACAACHTTGAAGAPKLGDAAGWSQRISQGQATLVSNAINGIRAMPAKGGNPDLDDIEVERAVVYLANQSGGKLKEPEVKAAPAAAAAPAATEAGAQTASATQPITSSPSQQTQAVASAAQPAAAAKVDGKKVYDTACVACHGPGVAGAPKVGDKEAWAPRIKQGSATMYEHAIKGFQGKAGVMPPKGGSTASDEEVKAAVDYMADASK
ncbi:c-type cytochrome [Noviherbaspirillum sp. CPCC 100848]|uniref:C-type cytochrome n=1 Tax=Noviherbaspirillum album TaxID=3080276 RepID=A0ABU6JIW3_9BURK|nr:c-type cytochrome [Noviherbaspirillum sp. CPCC 100848]MEC4723622.1 c-type cytochrome [Noviherbaspirillum sp. CPCC 100848]